MFNVFRAAYVTVHNSLYRNYLPVSLPTPYNLSEKYLLLIFFYFTSAPQFKAHSICSHMFTIYPYLSAIHSIKYMFNEFTEGFGVNGIFV
jgi:hypothetical protein